MEWISVDDRLPENCIDFKLKTGNYYAVKRFLCILDPTPKGKYTRRRVALLDRRVGKDGGYWTGEDSWHKVTYWTQTDLPPAPEK